MRIGKAERNTTETNLMVEWNLDGTGVATIDCDVPFLSHMLELLTRHSGTDLTVTAKGDVHIDAHHTTEDTGIALGQALAQALQDKAGIARYGEKLLPMDEALVLCAMDLSGRSTLVYDVSYPVEKVGDFDLELIEEFFLGFVRHAACTLHLKLLHGKNAHHIAEACFKAFAHALRAAIAATGDGRPLSTKGVL